MDLKLPITSTLLSNESVIPLTTLDPAVALDDLDWLEQAIGDARAVAIGESAHYNRESFELRHRLLRFLVERLGFSAYALESGFIEGWQADGWVRSVDQDAGEAGQLSLVMAQGMTSLMGLWTPMRDHLEWMRQHNRTSSKPIGFYGIDLPGSMVSLLPGLVALTAYLAKVDPDVQMDPAISQTASLFAMDSAFSAPSAIAAYGALAAERRDALTAALADLVGHMTARRHDYVLRSGAGAYERALRSLTLTVTLDGLARELARGSYHGMMLARDAAIADTVEWILGREERIVLGAHNAHVQRWPASLPGMPPLTTMGMHLADRLGKDYLVLGMTSATGQTLNTGPEFYRGRLFTNLGPAPAPGSLDALMASSHDGPFAIDLRRLSSADASAVQSVAVQRYGAVYAEINAIAAFDVMVHIPHVTPADPDRAALAQAPREVQEAFSHWPPS